MFLKKGKKEAQDASQHRSHTVHRYSSYSDYMQMNNRQDQHNPWTTNQLLKSANLRAEQAKKIDHAKLFNLCEQTRHADFTR